MAVRMPDRTETPERVQRMERNLREFVASVARSFQKSADDLYNRVIAAVQLMFWTRDQSDDRFAFKSHVHNASDVNAGTITRPVNTSSVQADLFLGGSYTGTSMTASTSVVAPVGVFNSGLASTDVRQRVLSTNFAAVYVDGSGQIGIVPSTRNRKNIQGTYAVDMTAWLSLPLTKYTYKEDPTGRMQVGFIADDLHEAGLSEFCLYGADGTLQGLRTDQLIAGLHSAYTQSRTQSLARLSTLETNANTLTGRVATLEGKQSTYALATDLTALTTRVGTAESNLGALTTRVSTAETNITTLTSRVKALEDAAKTKLRQRATSATMAALTALNSSQTLTITWPAAFADASYTPTIVSVTPPTGVLTSISARITAQTATTVTVLVYTAGIAVSAGTTVTIDGLHL